MRRLLITIAACWAATMLSGMRWAKAETEGASVLIIQGVVEDAHGNPVCDAKIQPFLNGKPFSNRDSKPGKGHSGKEEGITGRDGLYVVGVHAPPEDIKSGQWAIQVSGPSFKTTKLIPVETVCDQGADEHGTHRWSAQVELTLDRLRGAAFWIALGVLVGIYVLIALGLVHRTLAAFLGAAVILLVTHTLGHFNQDYEVLTFEQSLTAIDWNVIFLLMGMMVIVGVLKESGVFQWMAYKSFELTGGRIFLLSVALCVVTAALSAFLDNVTTMLLLTPVTMELALILHSSPFALLLPEIMASNFGGTATLIGDPPNIMIGSYGSGCRRIISRFL